MDCGCRENQGGNAIGCAWCEALHLGSCVDPNLSEDDVFLGVFVCAACLRGEIEREYAVKSILAARKNDREFLVWWKNYPVEESTWEPIENLINCEQEIEFKRERAVIRRHQALRCSSFPRVCRVLRIVICRIV